MWQNHSEFWMLTNDVIEKLFSIFIAIFWCEKICHAIKREISFNFHKFSIILRFILWWMQSRWHRTHDNDIQQVSQNIFWFIFMRREGKISSEKTIFEILVKILKFFDNRHSPATDHLNTVKEKEENINKNSFQTQSFCKHKKYQISILTNLSHPKDPHRKNWHAKKIENHLVNDLKKLESKQAYLTWIKFPVNKQKREEKIFEPLVKKFCVNWLLNKQQFLEG